VTEESFRRLFADHFQDVWRFARRRTASGADADDVTADTFAVAWQRRADLPLDAVRPWLFGVARLVLANHLRSGERRARLAGRLSSTRLSASDLPWVGDDPSTLGQDALWAALATLSPEDRELLLMRGWDDLAVAEIAVVLGIAAPTVSTRLHKARRRLKNALERQDPHPDGHVRVESQGERSKVRDQF
jgi:RNA polymerase sigma factor (sigma-70 family)